MSLHTLDQLFAPRLGHRDWRTRRLRGRSGYVVLRNLLAGGFAGPVLPVNPHHREICGALAYPDVAHLPETPDLALVCTPPETVPAVIEAVGARGIGAAIVVTAGLSRTVLADGTSAQEAMVVAARRHGTRILGPNCLGLIVPRIGLNASFAHVTAPTGSVAFVSQSGALATAVLDWARPRGIGFSCFVSLGDCADIGFGDVLDALGSDPNTRAILLYIESITSRRGFMSAARAAARNKPVVAVKAGRFADGMRAAQSHTGAMAGSDEVYDAALRRAGILRVFSVEEMFEAVETLARVRQPRGDRLGIVTNGGGIGVMAVDQLIEDGGHLAVLSPATLDRLNSVLPVTWSHGNPVDLVGDANGARYAEAMRILVRAPEVDGLLVMHAPTAVADSTGVAQAVADAARRRSVHRYSPVGLVAKPWLLRVRSSRRRGFRPSIRRRPRYAPSSSSFRYRRNQQTLMETPPSVPTQFTVSSTAARAVVNEALARITDPAAGTTLDERQSKAILAAYGIPTVDTHIALTPSEAALKARAIGLSCRAQDLSPTASPTSPMSVASTCSSIPSRPWNMRPSECCGLSPLERARRPRPGLHGPANGHSNRRPRARFSVSPPTRCSARSFCSAKAGPPSRPSPTASIELPPLNLNLARDLVSRTRVARLLRGARGHVPIDMHALGLALMQVAQMVVDIPDIVEMDINPLLASDKGVLALDARIRIVAATGDAAARLSIRPYPRELEEPFALASGRPVLLRPIRPEDEPRALRLHLEAHTERRPLSVLRHGSRRAALGDGALHADRLRP